MGTNAGDNWDLTGDIPPGQSGALPSMPGFDIEDDGDLMSRIRTFHDDGVGAWEENRRMHSEDLNFIYNAEAMGQWDPVVLQNRRGKPCYTFNRCLQPVNMVVADMRQTRPAGKVRPASDGASEAVSDVFAGLCRDIEKCSRADQIYKEQFKFAVAGGFGAWRIMPTYMQDDGDGAFDQVLRVLNIANPQTVVWDPQCADACAADANRCIVAERISDDVYDALYTTGDNPRGNRSSFNMSRDSYGWFTDKEVRIAEYFERVPREKHIAKMTDGTVREYDADLRATEKHLDDHGLTFEKSGVNRIAVNKKTGDKMIRKTIKWQVMWAKVDGSNILEGPHYYDWKRIPVIRCPGRYINIEGRKKFQSLIRHSKDAQRSYNSRASDMIERSALLPKAPYLVTEAMIKGYENEWNQANVASRPYLPYNVDKNAEGGMPFRTPPLDLPQGAMALAQMSIQDIQATIGYFDPALGNAEDMNRVSGKALVQHTKRSDLGSYEFIDGYSSAMQLTWEMFVDMIPTVMDSERVARIIGHDGIEKMVTVNQEDPNTGDIMIDLSKGSYDVEVTIGPSFQSARQEALDTLISFAEAMPQNAPLIADLIAKNIDTPDAQEMSKRFRIPLIQQGVIQPTDAEKKAGVGSQKNAQQQQQEQQQQLEMQLLQGKTTKMTADAKVAQSRAQASPMEQQKIQYETAGKHLANIKLAHEIGANQQEQQSDQQSAQMDLAAKHVGNLQDMTHASQQHAQDQMQQGQDHQHAQIQAQIASQAETQRAQQVHEAEMQRAGQAHEAEMNRMHAKHALTLKHTQELNEQKVAAAKAMAAAKPKKPKKAA
jgi:Phage P22-like portal protein